MIAGLKSLLFGASNAGAADRPQTDELHLAAAALLVESAVMDGHFETAERETIARVLGVRFGLNADETQTLIAKAEQKVSDAVELYGFTRVIKDRLEPEERVQIIEMLWEVAYADETLHDYEAGLVRRVVGLLYVSDRESGEARRRVLARLDMDGTPLK